MSKEDKNSRKVHVKTDAVSTAMDDSTELPAPRSELENTKSVPNVREIPLSRIQPDPEQPRKAFRKGPLEELAASIREHGVLQPISVEYVESEKAYRIISGERRWKASRMAGLEAIPCVIHKGVTNSDRIARQIVENLQRQDLSPIEKATCLINYKRLMGEDVTWREVETRTGLSKRRRQQFTALLNLPKSIQKEIIETGRKPARKMITEKHARALLRLNKEPERQRELFNKLKTSRRHISGDSAIEEAKRLKGEMITRRFTVTYSDNKELLEILEEKVNKLKESLSPKPG